MTRDSGKTARDWIASTSERTNRRPTMHRWLFEVDGGHGPTQWTRRRVEGTRPSRIDPVVAPNTARVSEKVTQKKSSSRSTMPRMSEFSSRLSTSSDWGCERGFLFLSALLHTQNDHFTGQNCCEGKTILKESVFADARYTAPILGFRRFGPMSSDLSYDVASGRSPSRKSVGSSGRNTS